MTSYCLYENEEEPGRACHRPKGHVGDHAEFPVGYEAPVDWLKKKWAEARRFARNGEAQLQLQDDDRERMVQAIAQAKVEQRQYADAVVALGGGFNDGDMAEDPDWSFPFTHDHR